MGRCIVKLPHSTRPYLEWSSIVDAPVTRGMSLEELREHIKREYGNEGVYGFPDRMRRVEARGSSLTDGSTARDVVSFNRAGRGETCLTMAQLVEVYCEGRGIGDRPEGHRHGDDGECGLCWPEAEAE
jgi:hypothetical protein